MIMPFAMVNSSSNNIKKELPQFQQQYKQTGQWVQLWDYKQSNPSCQYNCVSVWYTLWRFSLPDEYGYYQYCYVFQSNSKWANGYLANTGMQGTTIYVNGQPVTYLDYGVAGTTGQTQLGIYFKVHYNYVNKPITWMTKQMYLQ